MKKYFSDFQIMCMQGRTWEYANKIGISDDVVKAHSKELTKIINDNQKEGNANMALCEELLCKKFDEIKKLL